MSRRRVANRARLEFLLPLMPAVRDVLDGPVLFRTHSVCSIDVEIWCRRIRRLSSQRVDFAVNGGYYEISIHPADDVARARRVLWQTIDLHNRAFVRELTAIDLASRAQASLAAVLADNGGGPPPCSTSP